MSEGEHQVPGDAAFSATHWTVIYAARQESPEALEKLCRRYWRPLYAYIRHSGHSREESEDLVQGFFADLLSRPFLRDVSPEKGKFRSFLLGCYKHYAANVRARETALKRGGGAPLLPLELEDLEGTYTLEPVDTLTPEKLYLRRWARTLFEDVLSEVAAEYRGRSEVFRVIEPFLRNESDCGYRVAAEKLGMTENAFKQAVFRLREFFRGRFRLAVAQTLAPGEDLDQEIRDLMAALS